VQYLASTSKEEAEGKAAAGESGEERPAKPPAGMDEKNADAQKGASPNSPAKKE
jgi:hypothetical protein